ncbi:MAG TPA: ABC transporter permease [Pseudolysinimonas sp.]|jgi:ribose transport system permease protein
MTTPTTQTPTGNENGAARRRHMPQPQELMAQPIDLPRNSSRLVTALSKYAVVIVAIVLILVFAILNPGTFLTLDNVKLVLGSNSVALILAMAGLLPLIGGEFDLSIGYTLEISTVITAVMSEAGAPLPVTLLVVLVVGAAIGLLNAFFITVLGVSSFITTLGVGTVVSAISLALTQGQILITGLPQPLIDFAQGSLGPLPLILIPAAVVFVILWIVGEFTTYGRRLLAVGLSSRASLLAGVRVSWMVGSTFVIAGILAAFAGWLQLGRVGSASAGVGPSFLLPAIAAAFLGATTIKAGRFNVLGTGVAVLLVAVGVNGLELNGAAYWAQPLFDGAILLLAVGTAQLLARRAR